ncbi:hypothetical protein FLM9_558 [Candidatus Synechococcus spongiarum]|uniref:Uncharacterized protein n=1 Tax=Candidatus Synechococcus spongiarum TaxID=431041 RepID=A0A165AFB2_9SYNE|nr:hypothetical protein FLM9_558 [Candidatus Synechococcus spongiarum]
MSFPFHAYRVFYRQPSRPLQGPPLHGGPSDQGFNGWQAPGLLIRTCLTNFKQASRRVWRGWLLKSTCCQTTPERCIGVGG